MPRDPSALNAVLFANAVVCGAALVSGAICAQSMMADAVNEHEFLYGHRREGLFFAGTSFANKAASGLGGLFAGIALDLIAFRPLRLPKEAKFTCHKQRGSSSA